MTVFVSLSALLIALVLGYLLWPFIKGGSAASSDPLYRRVKALQDALDAGVLTQEEFESKRAALNPPDGSAPVADGDTRFVSTNKRILAGTAILLPVCAYFLYRMIGQPDTLSSSPPAAAPATSMTASTGATSAAASDMSSAISSLKKKLEGNPNDADGWLLLGRAYESVERNTEAASALKEAYRLAPTRPEIEIAYAEAMALTSPTRQLTGEPLRMIRHAMESDPSNQDGLWLIGMSDYQGGRYAEAIASWEKIKSQLSPDSDVLESVTKMIADANVRLGGGSLPAADMSLVAQGGTSTSPGNVAAGLGPKLVVEVSLPAEQRSRVSPGDTLFVYAKAVDGPPMPIAVQKLKASDLPATVELTDGMGMMPTMNLSQFEQVTVTARISKTGNAITQSGDLQGMSANVRVDRKEPLRIVIDKTAP